MQQVQVGQGSAGQEQQQDSTPAAGTLVVEGRRQVGAGSMAAEEVAGVGTPLAEGSLAAGRAAVEDMLGGLALGGLLKSE